VRQVHKVNQGYKERLVHKDCKVSLVHREKQDRKVRQDHRVSKGYKGYRVSRVHRESQEMSGRHSMRSSQDLLVGYSYWL